MGSPTAERNSTRNENMELDTTDDQDMAGDLATQELKARIARLEDEAHTLRLENKDLLQTMDDLSGNLFGIFRFKDSDSDINFYTGFPNYQTLHACYNFLNPGQNGENIVYVTSGMDNCLTPTNNQDAAGNKPGRRRKLSTLDEFFMVLVRMRLGLFELDLARALKRMGGETSTCPLCDA